MPGYYAPARQPFPGTVNLVEGSVGILNYTGEARDVVVASDWGRRVYFFRGGELVLEKVMPTTWPRGIDVLGKLVYIAVEDYVMVRSFPTGVHICTFTLTNPYQGGRKHITGIQFSQSMGKTFLTVCYDFIGPKSVIVYEYTGGNFVEHLACQHSVSYPRGAYYTGAKIIVADTFGPNNDGLGTVFVSDGAVKETFTNVYYPNTVYPYRDGRVAICAEHENRVIDWSYATGQKSIVMSGAHPLFSNISNPSSYIHEFQATTAGPTPPYPAKSICATEYSGGMSLYSPNSARPYQMVDYEDDEWVIADTDNNRVVGMRGQQIFFSITGFNNPVNAAFVYCN